MSRVCVITGIKPQAGQTRSHARNATKRRFLPNLQKKRYYIPSLKRTIQLTVSAKGIRMIDKLGIDHFALRINALG